MSAEPVVRHGDTLAPSSPLDDAVRSQLSRIPTSDLTTILARRGLNRMFMSGVRAIKAGLPRMVGPAFTLRLIPARPDLDTVESFSQEDALQRLALERCPPGSVLVIDARGDLSAACAGDAYSNRLKMRECAGLVTDGGLRDVAAIAELDFAVFLQAPVAPPTFLAHHPVEMNVPIGCGGVPVFPGDVVVGDSDGVVVIPRELIDEVVEEAQEIVAYDEFVQSKLAEGRSLIGLYPATPASREEYRQWREQRGAQT